MTTRLPVGVFFALFTISGFSGLIYQSIWSHYLKLFLGHAAYAQTLVLAIFMGGMAIGSWLVSRYTDRIANLLVGYAVAEFGIGVLALLFHRVFTGLTGWAFDSVMPALGGAGVDLFKWSLASALILPASVLLGTTFPLMSAGIMRVYPDSGGRTLSMLYFTNSFGAAGGVLASGFLLIDRLGLPGTILTAGILNILLAILVYAIAKGLSAPAPAPAAASGAPGVDSRRLTRTILVLALATGAASFIYEVTWIRMLTLGLGASTHAFEVMLAAFILAMSLGAFWFRNRISRLSNDLAWLAGLLIAKALFAVYAIWVYPDVLSFIAWMMQAVSRTDGGYTLNTLAGLAASMAVMFPAAFCAGMALPLATHVLTSRGVGEGAIGRVYAANTAGCIVGAAFATHFGMEVLGVKGLTGVGALLDAAMGVAVGVAAGAARRSGIRGAMTAIAVAGLAAFLLAPLDTLRMSSAVYRAGLFLDPQMAAMRFYRDGKTATISVIDSGSPDTVRTIRTNGKPDASLVLDRSRRISSDEHTMLLAAVLPLSMKPDAKIVANIGFGSGLTTHFLLGSPAVERVDSIEIERMMVEGAKLFGPHNERAYSDPRSRIRIEDAKTFFASAGTSYDVIVSEPSNPWVSGVSTLFSEEFYAQVKRYLRNDGLLVQWVQAYEIDSGLISTIFNALGRHFGDYVVYVTYSDLIVVATPASRLPPLTDAVFAMPKLGAEVRELGFATPAELAATRLAGRATLEPLFAGMGYPANSDYFPIVDQRAARARFRNQTANELATLRHAPSPVIEILDGPARIPLARLANPGPHRPGHVHTSLQMAEMVGATLTGATANTTSLPTAFKAPALIVHGLMPGCEGAQADWLEALTDVAQLAMPRLSAADLQALFDRARASRCARSLDAAGQRQLALLDAQNRLDKHGILEHSTALLAQLPPHLEARRGELLATAIGASVALGNRQLGAALRDHHWPRLSSNQRASLALQLAVAHLNVPLRQS
jgi:spermidine synthase